jgi:hypothetical protein
VFLATKEVVVGMFLVILVGCGSSEVEEPAKATPPAAEAPAPRARGGKAKKELVDADCETSLTTVGGDPGEAFKVRCAGGCATSTVYGTDQYTGDSRLCAAALHSGVIEAGGGSFRVKVEGAKSGFTGSKRNGVESRDWSGEWSPTYRVIAKDR